MHYYPKATLLTPENRTKANLNDAITVKSNELMTEKDEKSGGSKMVINGLTIIIL